MESLYEAGFDIDMSSSQFSFSVVKLSITKLDTGIDFDGIHTSHLRFISEEILNYLTVFIDMCFLNQHLPNKIMKDIIQPLVKNKFVDLIESNNYRENMNSSNLCKLFDLRLLPIIENYTIISHFQFGYYVNPSTMYFGDSSPESKRLLDVTYMIKASFTLVSWI